MTVLQRLSEAREGSRELDGLLARHFGWHRVEPRHTRNKAGGWIAPEDFLGVWERDGAPRLDGLHGTTIHRDPPRLSQSLDAALALAERVLPGAFFALYTSDGSDRAQVLGPLIGDGISDSRAATLPLALCLAILKAAPGDAQNTSPAQSDDEENGGG